MGALLMQGIGNPWIPILWILFCLLAAYMMVRYDVQKRVPSALAIGTLWGILYGILWFIFFTASPANNVIYKATFGNPDWISLPYWVLLTALTTGLAAGILIAIFTWMLKKVVPVKTP
ncbi:MAG: hypothetical protein Aureis2KO_25490 [Aureisphaera sp.]